MKTPTTKAQHASPVREKHPELVRGPSFNGSTRGLSLFAVLHENLAVRELGGSPRASGPGRWPCHGPNSHPAPAERRTK